MNQQSLLTRHPLCGLGDFARNLHAPLPIVIRFTNDILGAVGYFARAKPPPKLRDLRAFVVNPPRAKDRSIGDSVY
jgi:hypothetical protein